MKFESRYPLVLASQSPRRRELLGALGIPFSIAPSKQPEPDAADFQTPLGYVLACAEQKAREVAAENPQSLVIGSDTVVVLDEEVLLKPQSREQAIDFLKRLSGQVHDVITAVTVRQGTTELSFHEQVKVYFYDLPENWIQAYIATDDPYDKAGAYGIQTVSGLFVQKIDGDYNAVVGLPIAQLLQRLVQAGFVSLEGGAEDGQ